jgi:hypothetical protein
VSRGFAMMQCGFLMMDRGRIVMLRARKCFVHDILRRWMLVQAMRLVAGSRRPRVPRNRGKVRKGVQAIPSALCERTKRWRSARQSAIGFSELRRLQYMGTGNALYYSDATSAMKPHPLLPQSP